jgi:hypothetical protein
LTVANGAAAKMEESPSDKVVLDVSMSRDGFIAGPNVRPDEPMGDGGEDLHGRRVS